MIAGEMAGVVERAKARVTTVAGSARRSRSSCSGFAGAFRNVESDGRGDSNPLAIPSHRGSDGLYPPIFLRRLSSATINVNAAPSEEGGAVTTERLGYV